MGSSFFEDLRLIRETFDFTLDEIKRKTMIPKEILASFEATGLVGHPRFNSVYLHSLAKAYADALGISRSDVKLSVEETLSGEYRGRLAAEYLGLEVEPLKSEQSTSVLADEPETEIVSSEEGKIIDLSDQAVDEGIVAKSQSSAITPGSPTPTNAKASKQAEIQSKSPSESSSKSRSKQKTKAKSKFKTKNKKGKSFTSSRKSRTGFYLASGILTVAAALAAILWITLSGEDQANEQLANIENVRTAEEIKAAAVADSLAEIERQKAQEPVRWVLPDTMSLKVIAATDIIQAMEITRDQDEDHPRWVELGDTVDVAATEKFSLYKGIEGIELYLNGRPVPKELGKVTRYRIDIERTTVQAYFDSLDAVTQ